MFYAWGANSYGQLGLGLCHEQEDVPTYLGAWPFVRLSGGGGHTLAINYNGDLYACGSNRCGQLGVGHRVDSSTFSVTPMTKVIDVSGGWDFSLLLREDGSVYGCGSNKYLQLGQHCWDESSMWTEIPGLENIIQISCGLRHAAAVDRDGRVFSWGSGTKGQLGRTLDGSKTALPQVIPNIDNAVSVSCGQYFTIVRSREGRLFGFGQNKFGEIHEGAETTVSTPVELPIRNVEAVSCGWSHVTALQEGQIVSWGRNNYGQCCSGDFHPRHNLSQEVNVRRSSVKFVKVVSGSEHTLALDAEGRIHAWGWNEHGNCGNGSVDNLSEAAMIEFPKPVRDIFVGSAHCFALF